VERCVVFGFIAKKSKTTHLFKEVLAKNKNGKKYIFFILIFGGLNLP